MTEGSGELRPAWHSGGWSTCLARQFGKEVEAACSPIQFALSTRAGADCVEVPKLCGLLHSPDSHMRNPRLRHHIRQGEGGEQGDLLMPLLFSSGVHNSLAKSNHTLRPSLHMLASLDDAYILSEPERARVQRHGSVVTDNSVACGQNQCVESGMDSASRS